MPPGSRVHDNCYYSRLQQRSYGRGLQQPYDSQAEKTRLGLRRNQVNDKNLPGQESPLDILEGSPTCHSIDGCEAKQVAGSFESHRPQRILNG